MEGFKTSPKMQCFKEGGAVKYKSRHSEKTEMKEDVAKDKAMIKKAVKMHDVQKHEGEKTDLAKLKKGGRMKKEGGCVGRYKSGGGVSYGAKKTKEDRKEIAAIKRMNDGGMVTDEEKARMPAGKLPQQIVDEEAMKENEATRAMITAPVKKFKDMLLRKSDKQIIEQPILKPGTKREYGPAMKKGGKAC